MPAAKVPEGCYLANQSATQFEFFDEVGLVRVESLHPGSLIRARLARSGSHLDELLARGRHRARKSGNVGFPYRPLPGAWVELGTDTFRYKLCSGELEHS